MGDVSFDLACDYDDLLGAILIGMNACSLLLLVVAYLANRKTPNRSLSLLGHLFVVQRFVCVVVIIIFHNELEDLAGEENSKRQLTIALWTGSQILMTIFMYAVLLSINYCVSVFVGNVAISLTYKCVWTFALE